MSTTLKNILQNILGIAIGAVFLYLTIRDKDLDQVWVSLKNADLFWVGLSGVILVIVFIIKALRWRILLHNGGMPISRLDAFNATMMGFLVNSITPKFGEIVRCTNVRRTNSFKLSNILGSAVSERIWDVLVLLLGVLIISLAELDTVLKLLRVETWAQRWEALDLSGMIIRVVAVVLGLAGLWIYREAFYRWRIIEKLKDFSKEMIKTVLLTFKIKQYKQFLFLTFLSWFLLVLMNYCFLMALQETREFSLYFAFVVLFISGIGWAMPTPGGIGTTHWFILQLFIAFELSEEAGLSFGILSNGLNFVFTIIFGIIVYIFQEIRLHRLQAAAKKQVF